MTTDTPAVHTTTTTGQRPARRRMEPTRKIALAAGIAYLVTFAASIPQLKLFADVIADPAGYISNPGSNAAVQWGSVLEVLTAASGVATAVLLYPVTRRVSRSAAIGFVTSRVVEAALILVGVVAILSVVTLQQHFAGATGAQAQALGVTGESLVAMRQWTFLLGPGVMAGVNDLLLGYILYRSGLVGRVIPIIGLVGGPLILLSDVATILGVWGQVSTAGFLFALPVAVFEFSVGVYLTVKGFRSAALAALDAPSGSTPEAVAGPDIGSVLTGSGRPIAPMGRRDAGWGVEESTPRSSGATPRNGPRRRTRSFSLHTRSFTLDSSVQKPRTSTTSVSSRPRPAARSAGVGVGCRAGLRHRPVPIRPAGPTVHARAPAPPCRPAAAVCRRPLPLGSTRWWPGRSVSR